VLVEVLKALGVPNPKGTCGLNGAILLGMMSLPTMISVAEDALRAVPRELREAAYGLGADRWQTLTRVTLPAAGSGLIAAIILGMGRALGETMTVVMVTGNAREFPTDILGPLKTMTATIAQELGETTADSTHYFALFAVGLLLFFISLAVNLVAEVFAAKFRRGGR
jgi:phosphate transport system permease protein